ncbi:glutathione S-transferase family protein [Azospirillum sp. RWY-5-1]|uniref:Glutathione S-transferase family protein n=1 Tax=Azospirillum oleiclasticum TaxID=2735135 RepID=A0ABX2T1Z0_9PROT|nr:glutathione S-transferase family protein [Azospirillum oleiclasticum]NYZ10944.1 glutathione S-transferase family protein [Azospirillum oleiclasticum]NYZ18106.1 glutathione S-transferase family protein [Azospirillum oleiclasticum]
MPAGFTVYGNFHSQPAARVVLFLSMADTPFTYRHVDLKSKQQKSPEYLAISPFGRVPALRHGDLCLSESGVILTYLADRTGKFGGRNEVETLKLAQWISWMADVLLPLQRSRAIRRFGLDPNAKPFMDAASASGMTQLDAHLAGKNFVEGGRVTIADIFAFPFIDLAPEADVDLAAYPHIKAWYEGMLTLPGCRRQYDLMPQQDVG